MALPDMIVRIGLDSGEFAAKMKEVRGEIQQVGREMSGVNQVGNELRNLGGALSIGLTVPLAAVGAAAIDASSKMETIRAGLVAVSGSAEKAARLLDMVREAAKLPGLTFESAAQGATNLTAVGMSAEMTERILRSFGNALAAVGRGGEDLNAVVTQLVQMSSKASVVAGDLKPILERVPQAVNIIKQAFGTIDTEELQKKKISTQDFIEVVVAGLEKLPPAATTAKNEFDNARDTITLALSEIGSAIAPIAVTVAQTLAPAVKALADAFSALPSPVQGAIVAFGIAVAAAGPLILGLGQMITAVRTLALGVTALQGAIAASAGISSFVAVLQGIAAAAAAAVVPIALMSLKILAIAAVVGGAIYGLAKLGEAIFGAGSWAGWLADKFESAFGAIKSFITGSDNAKTGAQNLAHAASSTSTALDDATKKALANADSLLKQEQAAKQAESGAQKWNKALRQAQEETVRARTENLKFDVTWQAIVKTASDAVEKYDKAKKAMIEYRARLAEGKDTTWAINEAAKSFDETLDRIAESMQLAGQKMNDISKVHAPSLISAVPQMTKAAEDIENAWKTLGLPSPSEIDAKKKEIESAYETLKNSGIYSAEELQRAFRRMTDEVSKMPGDVGSAWKTLGLPSPQERAAKIKELQDAYEAIKTSGTASADDIKIAYQKMKDGIAEVVGDKSRKGSMVETVSTAITNFTQDMANALWDGDMSFGERVKKMFIDLGKAITSQLLEPWTKAISDWVSGVLTNVLGSALSGLFGGAAGAAGAAAGAAGSAAGAAGGGAAAGGAAAAVGGIAGGIGASLISGGIAAIGSIVGGFISSSRVSGDLGRIEENTRYTQIALIGSKGVIDQLWLIIDHFWYSRGLFEGMLERLGWVWEMMSSAWPLQLDRLSELRDRVTELPDRMRPVSVTVEGNVIGNEEFLDYMMREIGRRLSAQGA